jgi:hypothetical protein
MAGGIRKTLHGKKLVIACYSQRFTLVLRVLHQPPLTVAILIFLNKRIRR